ncbi:hypothetical protein M2T59_31425, partial [Klebsiella pneumoniae]|nr:hypothetical protein [Klebsiella pneumoniae]
PCAGVHSAQGFLRGAEGFWNRHKYLTKKVLKPLDFCGQDEYNTLSTQRKGVLNNRKPVNQSLRAQRCFHFIFIIGGQEL